MRGQSMTDFFEPIIEPIWKRSPIKPQHLLYGPQSAFARLFPDQYRRQQQQQHQYEETRRKQHFYREHSHVPRRLANDSDGYIQPIKIPTPIRFVKASLPSSSPKVHLPPVFPKSPTSHHNSSFTLREHRPLSRKILSQSQELAAIALLASPSTPRRVVFKRLPPLPARPRAIIFENWLHFKAQMEDKHLSPPISRSSHVYERPLFRSPRENYETVQYDSRSSLRRPTNKSFTISTCPSNNSRIYDSLSHYDCPPQPITNSHRLQTFRTPNSYVKEHHYDVPRIAAADDETLVSIHC